MVLWEKLGRNTLLDDWIIVLSYLALYSFFWLTLHWVVCKTAGFASAKLGSCAWRATLFAAVFALVSSVFVLLLLDRYVSAHGLTLRSVAFTAGATAVSFLISLWIATSVSRRFLPSPRWFYAGAASLLIALLLSVASTPDVTPQPAFAASDPEIGSLVTLDPPRVFLLGADGVDWVLLNRLVAEGRLPNIRRFFEDGVVSPLTTFSDKSPLIWTSIATGVTPEAHGVEDFAWPYLRGTDLYLPHTRFDFLGKLLARIVPYRDMRPFSSYNRKARAIWELATLLGRRVLVVNWWATYPAESINGALVSDYAFPNEVIDSEHIHRMSRYRRLASPERIQKVAIDAMLQTIGDRRLSVSNDPSTPAVTRNTFFVARDELAQRVFESLDGPDYDLKLLFLNAVDASSHIFTYDVFGQNVNEAREPRVSEVDAEGFWQDLVLDAYARLDVTVGHLQERLSENDLMVVVSDHGWSYDGTGHFNRPDGVMLLRGWQVRQGHRLETASVYDIFPTICYSLGLPVSDELEGVVLYGAFHPEFVFGNTVREVQSYGGRSEPRIPFPTELDRAYLERLRSLGYIE
jgi:hypothetical protein